MVLVQRVEAFLVGAALLFGCSQAGRPPPTREIAGVSVINTPIVRSAEAFALKHSSSAIYKHVMRSWLYGVLMINANETLTHNIDPEIHAIATLLHDLGWDMTEHSPILVWDAIALHTERSISYYKELEVQVVSKGISMDFSGPAYGVSAENYAAVTNAFPKDDLKDRVNQTIIWLCATKPQTTYDTWMQPLGERYVEGFNVKGKQRIDLIFQNLTSELSADD
ncbi:hypothetical protein F53441_1093 [Fusarium austroafricanum]|uniref:HD domain-containing protein n=1 Tax=Fusarium austroafricanum TaxID=2364996 RepID=A0A8H4KVD5_9HYPO|nr:hypothetical protein F53441_1093 [Fusarium austroafricanum]